MLAIDIVSVELRDKEKEKDERLKDSRYSGK